MNGMLAVQTDGLNHILIDFGAMIQTDLNCPLR